MAELCAMVFGLVAGFFVGALVFHDAFEDRAIEAGHAYYACAPDTGKCTFTWKAPQP